jgi:hypothetical protein
MPRVLCFAVLLLLGAGPASAQATWQPSSPPAVTANNESWFTAGTPIIWSGDYYYPVGARRYFNPYQMVRSGSYRGIPLYTDTTIEPYSMVFVPLEGGVMQPYERRREGALAGTVGSTAPSLPTTIAVEHAAVPGATDNLIQAPAPPMFARAYELTPLDETAVPVATAGASEAVLPPSASLGSLRYRPGARVETAAKPSGINGSWIEFEGRMWVNAGRALDFVDGVFSEAGTYKGFPVYRMHGDDTTLYVPVTPGKLAPYSKR